MTRRQREEADRQHYDDERFRFASFGCLINMSALSIKSQRTSQPTESRIASLVTRCLSHSKLYLELSKARVTPYGCSFHSFPTQSLCLVG